MRTGERFWEPELYRLRGELLLQQSRDRNDEAVADLSQAVAVAETVGARALAARAKESLERVTADVSRSL